MRIFFIYANTILGGVSVALAISASTPGELVSNCAITGIFVGNLLVSLLRKDD